MRFSLYRRNAFPSERPVQRAPHLPAKLPHPSLQEALRAFRQECTIHGTESAVATWDSGRRYMTHAGFRVRSKAEKIIADYLKESDIKFLYEPMLRVGSHIMRPDFYLIDDDLPYEHFGLSTMDYLQAAEAKIARYYTAQVPFMYTTFNDEPNIEAVIVDKLAEATLDM